MDWVNVKLFIRSFAASAFIGVTYLMIIELVHYTLAYQTALAHSVVVFVLYLMGIYFNYLLQKKVVFESSREAVTQFFAYNFFSAGLVSLLSSFFYQLPLAQNLFGIWIEAASTACALLIVSPISFLFFRLLFQPKAG